AGVYRSVRTAAAHRPGYVSRGTRACEAVGCANFVDECNWEYARMPSTQICDEFGRWSPGCTCPFMAPPGYPVGCPCIREGERSCAGAVCSSGTYVANGICEQAGCAVPCVELGDGGS